MGRVTSLTHFVILFRLVPFGFFVSLSVNEAVLPDRLASSATDVYSEGGRNKQVRVCPCMRCEPLHSALLYPHLQGSGLKSAFNYIQEKRDDMMPSTTKRV